MELIFEQSEEYNKANELIKKASAYKNDDIKKAIELIQEAINIYPYEEYYFKLANYKYDAGLINDSYGILNTLLTKYTNDSFINMKNANRSKKVVKVNF
jgi:tetratricopeptide (TPR) repeat protein